MAPSMAVRVGVHLPALATSSASRIGQTRIGCCGVGSASRRTKPHLGDGAGQDLGAPLAPEINGSLARDRFDSDCVLGTQFESSQPHHAFSF